jgi:hypothetical protein
MGTSLEGSPQNLGSRINVGRKAIRVPFLFSINDTMIYPVKSEEYVIYGESG